MALPTEKKVKKRRKNQWKIGNIYQFRNRKSAKKRVSSRKEPELRVKNNKGRIHLPRDPQVIMKPFNVPKIK